MAVIDSPIKKAARAGMSAYIVLCGPWLVLSILYLFLMVARENSGATVALSICATVCALWGVWLFGFKMEIGGGRFSYRDGFYRTRSIRADEIRAVVLRWVSWRFVSDHVKVPRLLVICDGAKNSEIEINIKPFNRMQYQSILAELKILAKESSSGFAGRNKA